MNEAKREFLVCDDYGMGGVWAYIRARSEDEIRAKFPSVTVVHERPSWLTADAERRIRATMSLDVDDSDHAFVRVLQAERRSGGDDA